MLTGKLGEIKALDKVLSETCTIIKDTSRSGSAAYVKVYEVKGNPCWKRIRIFFDERDKVGTIKIKDYYGVGVGVSTFLLIQVGTWIQSSLDHMFGVL